MTASQTQKEQTRSSNLTHSGHASKGYRIAVLIKQVPRFENIQLGTNGRMKREGLDMEINPYCRRAISKGVEIAHHSGGQCVVFTMGPPGAKDALKEALAWGADSGILLSDPAFAGSDTLATAKTLSYALKRCGPFDLILTGLNSVDSDTGQVPPEIAELLDLPFAAAVRELQIAKSRANVLLEQGNTIVKANLSLPCVLGVAERLCAPAKKPPHERSLVPDESIQELNAESLGPGTWGEQASPTIVGKIITLKTPPRLQRILQGPLEVQIETAVKILQERCVLTGKANRVQARISNRVNTSGPVVYVLSDPYSPQALAPLCAEAARFAHELDGRVIASVTDADDQPDTGELYRWGADTVLRIHGVEVAEDYSTSIKSFAKQHQPWAILSPSSVWGREVSARLACALNAGLTGDAVTLEMDRSKRLIAWKPAFGGNKLAAITTRSQVQMVTLRRGVLPPVLSPRQDAHAEVIEVNAFCRERMQIEHIDYEDDVEPLLSAQRVIGVGQSVALEKMNGIHELARVIGAEIAATRKVTDKGWLPRARQIGVTGISVSPNLYIAIGISGKYNHTVGIQSSNTILAINNDPEAPIFGIADIGIVADWQEVIPQLINEFLKILPANKDSILKVM